MEWSGEGKWDNCNSIINKYLFKKERNQRKEKKDMEGTTNRSSQHEFKENREGPNILSTLEN